MKSIIKIIPTLSILVMPLLSFSQSGSVKGIVKTSDGQPAEFVNVRLKENGKGAQTNNKGEYEIRNIKDGDYTLSVSFIGLETKEQTIHVTQNTVTVIPAIILKENSKQLNDVFVSSGQYRKYVVTTPSTSLRLNAPLIEVPQNITVVTQQSLKDFGINGTADLARVTSGVVKNYGSNNDFSFLIRGTDATNNNFRDGIGGYWWNQQSDAFMIDEVEFVKGPAGFMIGNTEPGGVFNEVSKQADGKRVREAEIAYGSYNLIRAGIDIGDRFKDSGKLSYRIVGGGEYTNSNIDFYKSYRTYILPSVRYSYKKGSNIQIEYTRMDGHYKGGNGGYNISFNGKDELFPENFNAEDPHTTKGINNVDNFLRLSNTHQFKNGWRLKIQLANAWGIYSGDQMWVSAFNTNFDTVYRDYYKSYWHNRLQAAQSFVDGKFTTGKHIEHALLTGIDYGNSSVASGGAAFDAENYGTHFPLSVKNPVYNLTIADITDTSGLADPDSRWGTKWLAWYGQDHIKFFGKIVLTVAGRFSYAEAYTSWDSTKVFNTIFTPRVGLTWLINKNMSLYILHDESFLPQTARMADGKLPDPLTGTSNELGYKAQLLNSRLSFNASVYKTVKNHVLVQNPQTTFYEERGQITSKGFEFAVLGNLGSSIVMNVNYAFTDAKITQDADNNNIGIRNYGSSKHIANGMFIYHVTKGQLMGLGAGAGVQFVGPRTVAYPGYTLPEEKDKTEPGYAIYDANISYDMRRTSFHLNVYNLFSKKYMLGPWWNSSFDGVTPGYYSFTPNLPINFRVSVNYRF